MRVIVVVLMAVMVVVMGVGIGADAADMVVVPRLHRAGIGLVADDLGAVLAQLAVHRRGAPFDLADPLDKGVEQQRVIAQIGRLDELDLGKAGRRCASPERR
jgi:hypothetical protein